MERFARWFMAMLAGLALGSCASTPPPPDPSVPGPMARQIAAERMCIVIVTSAREPGDWRKRELSGNAGEEVDGGSAAPISADGYFLTADHVLAHVDGKSVFLIFGTRGRISTAKARVVWRSAKSDLALLHVPEATPYFYRWTAPDRWISAGTDVIHGGISTGFRPGFGGKLSTSLAPESLATGTRRFKIDIPLEPGDSGGPVIDAYGGLVGINSAVEFLVPLETAFFVESEGNRPNTRKIEAIIRRDRERNPLKPEAFKHRPAPIATAAEMTRSRGA